MSLANTLRHGLGIRASSSNDSELTTGGEDTMFKPLITGISRTLALTLATAVLVVTFGAHSAHADKARIAVSKFSGPKAASFEKVIVKELGKKHDMVSSKRYRSTARRLKARRATDRNITKVARKLRADAVLEGSVERSKGGYIVILILHSAESGEAVEEIELKMRRAKLGRAERRKILRLISEVGDSDSFDEDADDSDEEADDSDDDSPVAKILREDDDEPTAKKKKAGGKGKDAGKSKRKGDAEDDAVEETDEDAAKVGSKRGEKSVAARAVAAAAEPAPSAAEKPAPSAAEKPERESILLSQAGPGRRLSLGAGASVITRNLSFNYRPDMVDPPPGYTAGLIAGGYVAGELYALRAGGATKPHNLGVVGIYDQAIGATSQLSYTEGGQQMVVGLATERVHWGVGAAYRYDIGKSRNRASVKLSARYNKMRFLIDRASAPASVPVEVPNVDYVYVDPGLEIRLPLGRFSFSIEGRGLLVLDTGEIQQADQYGSATMTGFTADTHVELVLSKLLLVQVGARWMDIGFDFDGNGVQSVDRDGDRASQDVGGARDRYIGGYATAGFMF